MTVGAANNTEIENNTFRMFNGLAIANLYGASDTVIVTGNNYQTTGAVQVVNDGSATNVTVSGNVDITATPWDKTPPSVSFGITGGTVISSTTNITVTATDAGAGVARVFFFVDGVPQGFDDTAPYIFSLDPSQFTVGSHVLSSVAVDHAANFGSTEATVSVQVARSFVLNARGLSALRTGPYAIDAKFFRAIS